MPPEPPKPTTAASGWFSRLRRIAVNGLIAAWLLLAFLQGFPELMPALQVRAFETARRLGLEHPSWSMFTPRPDHVNEHLLAELTFADGSTREVPVSPHWPDLGPGARLRLHRWSEYFDNVTSQRNPQLLTALSNRVLREQAAPGKSIRQIKLIVEAQEIPPPSWSSSSLPGDPPAAPVWERSVLWIQEAP